MQIDTKEDRSQADVSRRPHLAICPLCGQKLFEVESLAAPGIFRIKCRRCKKYIRVTARSD